MQAPKDIETFLVNYARKSESFRLEARRLLNDAFPGAKETLDESARIIGYSYGQGYKGVVCTLILSRTGAKLGIVRGSELSDPNQLMRGSGKLHRHVPLETIADLKRPGVESLLKAALTAWHERNEVTDS